MIEAIDGLLKELRPNNSKRLDLEDETREVRRIRLGKWRIIYLIIDDTPVIIGVRIRPPYNYKDIENLLKEAEQ